MEASIEKGRALVLAGPEGGGKSKLARELAAAHGSYVETDARALQSPFRLGKLLAGKPDTIIVNEVPAHLITAPETKSLVANESIVIHRKGCEEKIMPAPNFIFCTGDVNALRLHPHDRRFTVIRVGSAALAD
jgi:energy-coupling factor transporter ATP-binding protein EcfA2